MRTDSATSELGTQQLLAAAELGAGHLRRQLQPSGRFADHDVRTGDPIAGATDPRSHLGAMWALLDVRGYDSAVQAVAARGVGWAIGRYFVRTPQGGAFRTSNWLVTGCSGLALLALDELAPEHAPAAIDDIRPEIVDFLLAHQIADGPLRHDFPHRISLRPIAVDLARDEVSITPEIDARRSGHFTGEILFGLVTYLSTTADSLSSTDGDRFAAIYRSVGNALAGLLGRDDGVGRRSPWLMCAIRGFAELTERLLAAGGHSGSTVAAESRRDLLAWSSRIAAGVLAAPENERSARCAPAAQRVQSLVQFLELLDGYPAELTGQPQWGDLAGWVRQQVERDCALLLRLQDPTGGGFRGAAQEPVTRIDDTRYAISALLGAAYAIGR